MLTSFARVMPGTNRATGSSRDSLPSSASIRTAVEVNCLLNRPDAVSHRGLGGHGRIEPRFARGVNVSQTAILDDGEGRTGRATVEKYVLDGFINRAHNVGGERRLRLRKYPRGAADENEGGPGTAPSQGLEVVGGQWILQENCRRV
jgi:hypothetical protein